MRGLRTILALCVVALVVPAAASAAPWLLVDARYDRHTISPDIYGMNFADPALAAQIRLPVDRWGGNRTDTYNWQLGSSNAGADWYFENTADCWDSAHNWCADGNVLGYTEFVSRDRSRGSKTLLTLPMMGYVAKDAPLSHPLTCSFPVSTYGVQDDADPYDTNCGNGVSGGSPLAPDPTIAGTPVDATFSSNWIADLVSRYGTAGAGGVRIYELGNEPNLWSSTHRAFHPARTTYDELWQKSRDLAVAVKAADPSAKVLGFAEWGWPNYFCSDADDISDGCSATDPDRAAHGGTPLVEWFLQQMAAYQQANGTRLLDYLDVHYYAQGSYSPATDVTRSLWDPGYVDPSWIGAKIRLIPRMREWIAANYPGTKISLSEYDLRVAGDSRTNTLIEADTLGIFARERLDLATMWDPPSASDPVANAFRMYRNYNGRHATFGDSWVRSRSWNQRTLAVYGAKRTRDGVLTVVAINKSAHAQTVPLSIRGFRHSSRMSVYRWAGGTITRLADRRIGSTGFSTKYPARSITLFVIRPAA